jgi:septation ring formation regulator EzrA
MEELLKQILSELKELKQGQEELRKDVKELKQGQEEIKGTLRHNMTLISDNFTIIRKDIRTVTNDIKADVDLLFKEVEGAKRQANKIEQRLGN